MRRSQGVDHWITGPFPGSKPALKDNDFSITQIQQQMSSSYVCVRTRVFIINGNLLLAWQLLMSNGQFVQRHRNGPGNGVRLISLSRTNIDENGVSVLEVLVGSVNVDTQHIYLTGATRIC